MPIISRAMILPTFDLARWCATSRTRPTALGIWGLRLFVFRRVGPISDFNFLRISGVAFTLLDSGGYFAISLIFRREIPSSKKLSKIRMLRGALSRPFSEFGREYSADGERCALNFRARCVQGQGNVRKTARYPGEFLGIFAEFGRKEEANAIARKTSDA